jgi:NUC153 domain
MAGTKKEVHKSDAVSRKRPRSEKAAAASADSAPPAVTDERFAALHWDPRFSRVPKRASKLAIDERFREPLRRGKAFRGSSAPVDRFGRVKAQPDKDKALERLYDIVSSSDDDGDDNDDDGTSDENAATATAKTSASVANVNSEDGSSSDSDSRDDVTDKEDEEAAGNEQQLEVIPRGDATRRLAVIGLDWSNARAVDIFASLQSFCPPGKLLTQVKVVPSKFGMERMAAEAKFGPQVLSAAVDGTVIQDKIHSDSIEDNGGVSDGAGDSDAEINAAAKTGRGEIADGESVSGSESETIDNSDDENVGAIPETALDRDARLQDQQDQMRKYEEERLKYFYAVADFEDAKTAEAVYEQCDGVEFESTGLAMDLRFVPDDMVIDAPVRDVATCIPDGYAPLNLAPSTLNNCKVKLSWDADAPDRALLKKKSFGKHDVDEENLKAYLASSSESEGEADLQASKLGDGIKMDNKEEVEKKRMLLLGGTGSDEDADDDMEMEVSFEPGLLEKGEDILKRKDERNGQKEESAWETRLRRMQERKAEKKKARKEEFANQRPGSAHRGAGGGSDDDDMYDKSGVANPRLESDPFFNAVSSDDEDDEAKMVVAARTQKSLRKPAGVKVKAKGGMATTDADAEKDIGADKARRDAELELVMMDDDRKKIGGSLRDRLAAAESDDEGHAGRRVKAGRTRGRRRRDRDNDPAESAAVSGGAALHDGVASSAVDVTDDRFSSLFSSHLFAMDPTHPKFKRDDTTDKILAEKTRRGGSTAASAAAAAGNGMLGTSVGYGIGSTASVDVSDRARGGDDIMRLAASIKAKSKVIASQRKQKPGTKRN